MQCSRIFIFLVPFVLVIHEAHSGVIFDGVKKVTGKVKCGLHKFGNALFAHDHKHGDPCNPSDSSEENSGTDDPRFQSSEEGLDENETRGLPIKLSSTESSSVGSSDSSSTTILQSTTPQIDIRIGSAISNLSPGSSTTAKLQTITEKSTTEVEYATVPGGKHIIGNVKANCEAGYVYDTESKRCRETG